MSYIQKIKSIYFVKNKIKIKYIFKLISVYASRPVSANQRHRKISSISTKYIFVFYFTLNNNKNKIKFHKKVYIKTK